MPTADVTSGDKYDSSHALKHESYLSLRGVHSELKLCAMIVERKSCFTRHKAANEESQWFSQREAGIQYPVSWLPSNVPIIR